MSILFINIILAPICICGSTRTKPSIRFFRCNVFEGNMRLEHSFIGIKDLSDEFVDSWR